jgi:hypothetical protein
MSHLPALQRSEQHWLLALQLSPPNLHEKSSTQVPWSHEAGKQQSADEVQAEPPPWQKRPSRMSTVQPPFMHV